MLFNAVAIVSVLVISIGSYTATSQLVEKLDTTAQTQEIATSANQMSELANQIQQIISKFKIESDDYSTKPNTTKPNENVIKVSN